MTRAARRCAIAFFAFSLPLPLSCGGGGGAPFVGTVSRSQFFEYHDQVDEPLCPTLLSMLDQHAQQIGGKIGLHPDPDNPIIYYKFRDVAAFEGTSVCPESAGCANAGGVYSPQFFHAHELAHTYTFRAWGGHPTGLVAEGEAVALSCEPGHSFQPTYRPRDVLRNPDWRDFLYLFGNSTEGYVAAGYWITYLADRYGWDSVRRLHQRALPGISPADFEREFARVFPISMDEAWSAALGTAGAPSCQDEWRCMSTPLAVGDRVPPACDGEMHRSITVTDQPGVALTLDGITGEITLGDCANPAAPLYRLFPSGERTSHLATLPAGTYTLFGATENVERGADLPITFDGDSCATGGVALDPAQVTYIDLHAGRANGWIPIAGGGQSYLVGTYNLTWNGWPTASGGPEVCDGCSAAATCVPLPPGEQTMVTIGDGAVLRLLGASAVESSDAYGHITFFPAAPAGSGP